jgi:hypothetical protein
MTLTSYTVPALNAVDFALVTYTQPVYNTIDFELLDAPSSPIEVFPGVGVLTMTGYAPTVVATDHKIVYPGLGELVMTGYAPTVTVSSPVTISLSVIGGVRAKPGKIKYHSPGKFGGLVKYVWTGKGRVAKKR